MAKAEKVDAVACQPTVGVSVLSMCHCSPYSLGWPNFHQGELHGWSTQMSRAAGVRLTRLCTVEYTASLLASRWLSVLLAVVPFPACAAWPACVVDIVNVRVCGGARDMLASFSTSRFRFSAYKTSRRIRKSVPLRRSGRVIVTPVCGMRCSSLVQPCRGTSGLSSSRYFTSVSSECQCCLQVCSMHIMLAHAGSCTTSRRRPQLALLSHSIPRTT